MGSFLLIDFGFQRVVYIFFICDFLVNFELLFFYTEFCMWISFRLSLLPFRVAFHNNITLSTSLISTDVVKDLYWIFIYLFLIYFLFRQCPFVLYIMLAIDCSSLKKLPLTPKIFDLLKKHVYILLKNQNKGKR